MKEFGKSLLLVMLTISAILMTKSVFVVDSFEEPYSKEEYVIKDLLKLIKPQNYSINFGDSFIKIYSDEQEHIAIRDEYNKIFNNFINSSNDILIEETSMLNWQDQTKRKSIRVDYPFSISLKILLELYGIKPEMTESSESISVSSILFLVNNPNIIYIKDDSNYKYYRIPGENVENFAEVLYDSLFDISEKPNEYRMLESRFKLVNEDVGALNKYGLDQPNLLLTPITLATEYPKYEMASEIDVKDSPTKLIEAYAKEIFANDMSFVKKSVYYDNSTIYIYGYGEKVFKVNSDGSLEYLVKANANTLPSAIEFVDGLNKSMNQINKMGVPSDTIYLSNYSQIKRGDSYETVYNFNYRRYGIPFHSVQSSDGSIIEVKFLNTDLVKAKKYARIRTQEINDTNLNKVDFKDIFTINSNEIEFVIHYKEDHNKLTVDDSDIVLMCLYEMKSLELNYYIDTTGLSDKLTPVWNLVIANTRYFIEIDTGKIIRFEKVNKE